MGLLTRLHQRVRAYFELLLSEHRSPARVALAVLLGCIVGCLPLFGVHIFLCVFLARLFGLNLLVMYGAANVSVPPVVPLIGWSSVQLGSYLMHGRWLELGRNNFTQAALPGLVKHFFLSWMLGGTLLGAGLGTVFGSAVYIILTRRAGAAREEAAGPAADVIGQALTRAGQRYAQAPRQYRYYVRAKYRLDPCYRALCERIPEGAQVVDLGCGLGMLGMALAELQGGRRTWGVDWDHGKLEAGQAAAAGLPDGTVTLCCDDLRTAELPPGDVVTLIDVLHYYDEATQDAVLSRAASGLRPGGRLFIRETDRERAGGARLTRFFERAMVSLGWNRGPRVYYRSLDGLHRSLQALGFTTEQVDVAGATHPGNVLLCAFRSGEPQKGDS